LCYNLTTHLRMHHLLRGLEVKWAGLHLLLRPVVVSTRCVLLVCVGVPPSSKWCDMFVPNRLSCWYCVSLLLFLIFSLLHHATAALCVCVCVCVEQVFVCAWVMVRWRWLIAGVCVFIYIYVYMRERDTSQQYNEPTHNYRFTAFQYSKTKYPNIGRFYWEMYIYRLIERYW